MAKHKTTKARRSRQKLKEQYSKSREDAQLHGLIPTTPEGAVHGERVDPVTQGEQALPGLVSTAIRKGWAVPEEKKPVLVDEMIDIATDTEQSAPIRVMAYNAVRLGDQKDSEIELRKRELDLKERQGPERAGQVNVNVNNLVQVSLEDEYRAALRAVESDRISPNADQEALAGGEVLSQADAGDSVSGGERRDGGSGGE